MSYVLLLYDAVDTGTDAKLVVDLFKGFDYALGVVAVFSILFGLFNFTLGVGALIPNSILKKIPSLKYLVITKKNIMTEIFALENETEYRLKNLFMYLFAFKLPEDLTYAVLRLLQHDLEKDIFYMIGTVSTVIGLCVALITIGYVVFDTLTYPLRIGKGIDVGDIGLVGFLVVAFVFIVSVIILSCRAVGSRIVLSFGIRIMFYAALGVLGILAVMVFLAFLTDPDEEPEDMKTCFDVVKEKMCCKRVDIEV